MNNSDATDALKAHDEARQRRNAMRYPPMQPGPMGTPWRYEMTEQQKQELEQRIKDENLPF